MSKSKTPGSSATPSLRVVIYPQHPYACPDFKEDRSKVSVTGYRLLYTVIALAFGSFRATLALQGHSLYPSPLELLLFALCAIGLFWASQYESVRPHVYVWFFHEDYLGILSILSIIVLGVVLPVTAGLQSPTMSNGRLVLGLFIVEAGAVWLWGFLLYELWLRGCVRRERSLESAVSPELKSPSPRTIEKLLQAVANNPSFATRFGIQQPAHQPQHHPCMGPFAGHNDSRQSGYFFYPAPQPLQPMWAWGPIHPPQPSYLHGFQMANAF